MTAYEIKLYNEETKRYHFLAMIDAETKKVDSEGSNCPNCNSSFGCCEDGENGKRSEDDTCCWATYDGCCSDGMTPMRSKDDECCSISEFGCCPDEWMPKKSADDDCGYVPPCGETFFGCCEDGETAKRSEKDTCCWNT